MIEKLRDLKHAEADEFAAWQIEDMHRQHAAVHPNHSGAYTIVRPHSRYEVRRHQRNLRRLLRHGRYIGKVSTRPILRPELLDQLSSRLSALLENLRW
jgi:hypothetical protein